MLFKIDLEKIIKNINDTKYYDIDYKLSKEKLVLLKDELIKRLDSLKLVEIDGVKYIIDGFMLNKEVNLDCFKCSQYNKFSCCDGEPHNVSKKNRRLLSRHIHNIINMVRENNATRYNKIITEKGFMSSGGRINTYNGRCTFLIVEDGISKCAIHKYAFENDIPLSNISSFSCILFPMEIIELYSKTDKYIYITSVADKDAWDNFGRWDNFENDGKFVVKCIYKEKHGKTDFKESDYIETYKANKNLLIDEFGEMLYNEVESFCKGVK